MTTRTSEFFAGSATAAIDKKYAKAMTIPLTIRIFAEGNLLIPNPNEIRAISGYNTLVISYSS
jgi:hypothetical protein